MKCLLSFLLMAMCVSNIPLFSQSQKTTMELLMSTKWEPQDTFEEGEKGYVEFSDSTQKTKYLIDGELQSYDYSFYLSFSQDTLFDKAKVGVNSNGKYIILNIPNYVFSYEIIELTTSKLVLRFSTPKFSSTGHIVTYLPTNMSF